MSRLTRLRQARSHVLTHHQTHTVIHPTHRQVPATYQTSMEASMALMVNI